VAKTYHPMAVLWIRRGRETVWRWSGWSRGSVVDLVTPGAAGVVPSGQVNGKGALDKTVEHAWPLHAALSSAHEDCAVDLARSHLGAAGGAGDRLPPGPAPDATSHCGNPSLPAVPQTAPLICRSYDRQRDFERRTLTCGGEYAMVRGRGYLLPGGGKRRGWQRTR